MKSLMQNFPTITASGYLEGWKGKVINDKLDQFLADLEETGKLFGDPPRNARLQLALTTSDPQAEFMSKSYREARDDAFKRIGAFFQNVTHHRHQPDEGEFRGELGLLESLLLNYLTPCTAAQQNELLSLIAGPPNQEALARVNELISHKGANYVFFFDKLDNPNWLGPLEQQGHFADLPQPDLIMPERLESMLDLFKTLLKKPSDELRWSIQFKDVAPVISLGLANDKPSTKKLAEECKDLLLKMGFSDFLNLGNEEGEK